ncbi:hypothetical protein [Halorussus amylolyticus]|uniref:hypothetical protein n=1 Tax=Halorussus amylolyticus TaxID=1126242 RepID=UPI0010440F31|nr:hypothetical protein [Halorussus amylolyticus]
MRNLTGSLAPSAVALALLVTGAGFALAGTASASDGPDWTDGVDGTGEADTANATNPIERQASPDLPEQWQRTYGGDGDDTFADLVRTGDGGYLLVGAKEGESLDGWAVKIDSEGETQWERTLGGQGLDRFYGVAVTDDGYLLAGRTDGTVRENGSAEDANNRDGGPNGWVVELGPDGEVRDERTPGSGAFYALESDGSGFLFAGWTRGEEGGQGERREGWALRLDAEGTSEWSQTYATPEGYSAGYLRAIVPIETDEGADGYYLAGKVEGDSDDAWALRVESEGSARWQATAGGSSRDDVWAAAPASAGAADGFVLAGETESNSTGPRDGWLVKFDANGSVGWERRHGGDGTQWLDSAMRTADGFLFTGSSNAGPYGSADGYVVATDASGVVESESYYGTDAWDKPWPAIRAHGGGYLLAGQTAGDGATGRDGWVVRIGGSATGDATVATSETTTANTTTAPGATTTASGTGNPAGDSDSETTESVVRGGQTTATENTTESVPGFGIGVALVAFAVAATVARFVRA